MKILNFGSLNIDYVYKVDHFVTPGETISSGNLSEFCGGKGLNQSIALAKAGADVFHAGRIGTGGEILVDKLYQFSVSTGLIEKDSGPNGHAIIQVDKNGQNCIILYSGSNHTITPDYVDRVLSNFQKGDIILLQNEISCMPYIMETAYRAGIKIAFNPSPIGPEVKEYPLDYVSWFLLNEIEGEQLSGQKEPEAILNHLASRFPDAAVVLTLGKKGVLFRKKDCRYFQESFPVEAVDTTAAGDTFTGYFLAGISRGKPVPEVLRFASLAASITVSRNGAADSIPLLSEVEEQRNHIYKG